MQHTTSFSEPSDGKRAAKKQAAALMSLTDKASQQIQSLLAARDKPSLGVRISLKTKGCSGMAYSLEYVDNEPAGHERLHDRNVTLYIDPAAVLFLVGTQMDFDDNPLAPGFIFTNPNEKGRCGCGQSFHV